jgi:hypothetical protein
MKNLLLGVVFGVGVLAAVTPGWGQTHKVANPENVVRAVGVYEWTGDLAKPTASRLIPISLFIEGKLEDAGVYIARPVPFALLTGNVYELQDAGIAKGTLELSYARHLQTADAAYDDGWFGYGTFHAPASAKKTSTTLRASKTLPVIASSTADSSKPHFSNKGGDGSTAGSDADKTNTKTDSGSSTKTDGGTPATDPDRPTMKRRTDSDSGTKSGSDSSADSGSTQGGGSTPAEDPDRPTMKRRTPDSGSSTGSNSGDTSAKSGGSDPADDPDRPTLRRRSPEEAKKAQKAKDDEATVTATGSLNDDPNRPNLHRGKPASAMTETDLPKLVGLPPDLHQVVAVSDARTRDPHEFARPWEDAAEKSAVLAKMQAMARAQLASYRGGAAAVPAQAPAATPTTTNTKSTTTKPTTTKTTTKKTPASRSHRPATPPPPAPVALLDEELKGYMLSYGGAATYVYTAHTAGTGADLRYVTVVAQADALGELKPAMQSATDAAHLDRTPRMRFVDAVDVEASNRASLLFELRGQSSRQFGLYRVIAAKPEQIFLTGTTQ